VAFPVLRFLSPPEIAEAATHQVDAGPVDDPELLDKGFKIVEFGGEPVIVVRAGEADFRAFSATCTHLACIVEYRPDMGLLWCNCHNGSFDLLGRNVAGPPPRPLAAFAVHRVAGTGGADHLVVARS
jgi:Rieske Fe-S protein